MSNAFHTAQTMRNIAIQKKKERKKRVVDVPKKVEIDRSFFPTAYLQKPRWAQENDNTTSRSTTEQISTERMSVHENILAMENEIYIPDGIVLANIPITNIPIQIRKVKSIPESIPKSIPRAETLNVIDFKQDMRSLSNSLRKA